MTALAVARYLQDATGISIKRIIRTLKPIHTAQIHLADHTITASHPLTPPRPSTPSTPSTSHPRTNSHNGH